MSNQTQIGIIGGGIGGAILARALLSRGFDCHVFEQAPAFGEIGAGVQVTPNAVKVLKALGLEHDLERIGFCRRLWSGTIGKPAKNYFGPLLKQLRQKHLGPSFIMCIVLICMPS